MKRIERSTKPLTPRMKQVVQALFDNPSLNQEQLGQLLGISGSRVNQILHSNRVLEAFPTLARAKLKSAVPKAAKRYVELMEQTENLEVARKVADRLLDTHKVLEPETRVVKHEFEIMPTKDLVERVRDGLKISASNEVFDTEIVETDENDEK